MKMQAADEFHFRLYPLRFEFVALAPVVFPESNAGNVFRGALGFALRKFACVTDCPGFGGLPTSLCPIAKNCAYAQLFEPVRSQDAGGPSGLEKQPRAFVLRASHLDGCIVSTGDSFYVDLHLFLTGPSAPAVIASLEQAFGCLRTSFELIGVTRIDAPESPVDSAPLTLSLAPPEIPCSKIHIDFLTPTELKLDGKVAKGPAFHVLFQRVRDRLSTLRALYGAGPLAIDFRGMAERAALIQLDRCSITQVEVERRSSRTGQVHSIGGFIGDAQYSGDLAEFLPWLYAAEWTGVGRQTVWGKGYFRVRTFAAGTD